MGRPRSRTPSRKRSHRRSLSRSKNTRKSRHHSSERKSSKYRHRSDSSDSSTARYKASSSSKYKSSRNKKRDSRSPSSHRGHRFRRSTSSSDSSSQSGGSSSSSSSSRESKRTHRSSSAEKQQKKKPSSTYMDKIRSMRTPTPPPSQKLNFDAGMEFLDKRQVSDALEEINANEFRPKTFNSSTNKNEKIDADSIKVKGEPKVNKIDINDDPLFHQKVC